MKENDSSVEENSNYLESINIPTYSAGSLKKYKKKRIRINEKNDKDEDEEFNLFRINNNNNIENPHEVTEQYLPQDLDIFNKKLAFDKCALINEEKKNVKVYKKFGRKRKDSSETGKHNKYSGDNLFRKCKGVILNSLYILINNIIEENYKNDSDYDKKNKKLLKINQNQIINSEVKFNKEFISTKLKDIFSDKVTSRCSRYSVDHNKNLIQNLLNEKDEQKKKLFEKIFNLTFLECLNHFRGTKPIKELEDLIKYDDVCKNFEEDEDYLYSFKFYIDNYEKIIEKKKSRKKKNEKGKE